MVYKTDQVRILLVDDMPQMLQLLRDILETFGFSNVYTAHNGDRAMEMIIKEDPDLIITDWWMKPMNGLELTRTIRRSTAVPNPYVPILMMTGFSSRSRVMKARDEGITEFLVKPFTANDLYSRIQLIIEKPRQFVDTGEFFGPDRRRGSKMIYDGPNRRDQEDDE